MKTEIHPQWFPEATVVCQCGNTWTTGATVEEIRTEICSACHPFFTGEQRIVDTEGRVDKFMQRLERRNALRQERNTGAETADPTAAELSTLELDKVVASVLAENGLNTIADVVNILEANGDEGLTALDGIGQNELIDLKKAIRGAGVDVPASE